MQVLCYDTILIWMARVSCSKFWFLGCLCIWGCFAPGRRDEHPTSHGRVKCALNWMAWGWGHLPPPFLPMGRGLPWLQAALVTPTACLSSSPRRGTAELLAALLPSLFMSLLWAHRIFVIVQSMSPVHPNQLKLIFLKAGLLQVYLEVMYGKAVFFSFLGTFFITIFRGKRNWILQEVMTFACKSFHLNFEMMQ